MFIPAARLGCRGIAAHHWGVRGIESFPGIHGYPGAIFVGLQSFGSFPAR